MAQALYRKYRSQSLSEVMGQAHVINVLKRALEKSRTSHAYLLTGPRGVGKTSVARILAYEINKLPYSNDGHLDIIEIDAASNNGVDDVRDLREKVTIVPVSASKKIYIIDEVHMLSKPAFNALLKTLEEPPAHVVFILATTEVHKLPDTILSRTQRFHFRPIELGVMESHLRSIADKEKIIISDEALTLISQRARGSFRDGISLLDQLSNISEKNISSEMVESTLGLADIGSIEKLGIAITNYRLEEAIKLLNSLEQSGISALVLSEQLSHHLKQLIVSNPRLINLIEKLIDVARSYDPQLKLLAVVASAASQTSDRQSRSIALEAVKKPILITAPPIPITPTATELRSLKEPTVKTIEAIEWSEVLKHIRDNHLALYGVLQKAEASYQDGVLNLHFSYALHRKKLEDGKYRQLLTESLVTLYDNSPDITISSGKRAPSHEQAAAVAAIMGGGEEVVLQP